MYTILLPALCTYLVFKEYEPYSPWVWFLLLALQPLVISFVTPTYSIFTTYLIFLSTILLATAAYRLSPFHPLARYPGPKIGIISKIWFAMIARTGKQYEYYYQLHQKYGDIVRTGPNELSFADPQYINLMMGASGMPKGPHWDGRLRGQKVKGLIGLRNTKEHADRRRRWRRAFTAPALKEYEVIIEKRATQLGDHLAKHMGKPFDLTDIINRFTFDLMMDMTFDGGSEMLRDGDVQGIWHVIEHAQPDSLLFGNLPWLSEIAVRIPSLHKGLQKFRDLAINRAIARKKEGALNKDIIYYLLDEQGDEEKPVPLSLVLPDSVVALLAGSDTTATTLSCLCVLLMRNPDKLKRLQQEVNSTTGHIMDTATNAAMPYLNAAINESLRLYPPVLSGSHRGPAVGSGGHMLGEHFIPERTNTVVHTYTLHHDPRNFSLPEEFIPERWLPPFSPLSIKQDAGFAHNPTAFIPFSYGPANCIGKQLAYQEMRVVVRMIVERFEMKFAEGYDNKQWDKDLNDQYVAIKGKLPIVLTPREFKTN